MRKLVLIVSIFSLSSFVVTDSVELLKTKIANYLAQHKRAKVDIFFNQPKYSAGDTAYFRVLYVSATDHALIMGNEIINIHLFDSAGNLALSKRAIVENGIGGYELTIPNNLKSGIYKLVAYTNWMRNHDQSLYFSKNFVLAGENIFSTALDKNEIKLGVSIEGGHLIADINNNVLVSTPRNTPGTIHINTRDGEEIVNILADSTGYTLIPLIPKNKTVYFVEFFHKEKSSAKIEMPMIRTDGFAVRIGSSEQSQSNNLLVEIERALKFSDRSFYLLLIGNNGVVYNRELKFESTNQLRITLPKIQRGGIFQLTIVDDESKIWAERAISIANTIDITSEISISNTKFKPREEIEVNSSIINAIGEPVSGLLSVRVVKKALFEQSAQNSKNIFGVSSDIGYGNVYSEFSSLNQSELNRILIGEKCDWLNFDRILKEYKPKYPITNYQTLTGRIYPYPTSKIKDSLLLNLYLPNELIGYDTYVKSDGAFQVPINYPFYDQVNAFYSITSNGRSQDDLSLEIYTDSIQSSTQPFNKGNEIDPYFFYSFKKRIIENSYNYFLKGTTSVEKTNSAIEQELGGVDVTLNLGDYVPFTTMSDVVREVLKFVDHRKSGEEDFIRVYTSHKYPTNKSTPLFVIDGILTRNVEQFLSLNPKTISSIKVVKDWNKLINLGTLADNGVILVSTKGLDTTNIKRQEVSLSGFCKPYAEMPLTKSALGTPDLRPCLYWNSNIPINRSGVASFRFYATDEKSEYAIEIIGLTKEGNVFHAEKSFLVY